MVRQRGSGVELFANLCRDRGSKVELEEKGQRAIFRCQYHGWAFAAAEDDCPMEKVGSAGRRNALSELLSMREMKSRAAPASSVVQGNRRRGEWAGHADCQIADRPGQPLALVRGISIKPNLSQLHTGKAGLGSSETSPDNAQGGHAGSVGGN